MPVLNFFDILALKPNFFDDADIDERLDKEELKMAILERCGTLLPVYTRSEMFKSFSDSFFKRRKNIISKLIDTTEFEYNPIHNYDRIEKIERAETLQAGIGSTVVETPNTTQTIDYEGSELLETEIDTNVTETLNTSQQVTNENKVSAYDSSEYQPKEQTIGNTENSGTNSTDTTQTGENTTTKSDTTTTKNSGTTTIETSKNGEDVTTERITTEISGNIGVTSTQKMIESERKVVLFNVYHWIAIEFEQNFFICVS